MKFELNFDENIYNQQMDLLFDLAWERKIKYYKNSQYLGFLLIILGVALIYNRPNIFGIGYVFIFFGLTNLIAFVYYYFKIKSTYRKFNVAKKSEIETNSDMKDFSWEFTEEAFIMNAGSQVKTLPWEEFTNYLIKDDNLILITKDYRSYILGEIEVGNENFKMIISFVENKIRLV